MKKVAVRNIRLCTKDCLCLYVCPTGASDTENGSIDAEKCIGCGVCAESCPSKAISMVPVEFPPQQAKENDVVNAVTALARNKAAQEKAALQIAEAADSPVLRQLMQAMAKSNRLMAEDLLREAGYMLPQSGNTHAFLKALADNPPAEDFPLEIVKELLGLLPDNDAADNDTPGGNMPNKKKAAPEKWRCSICGYLYEGPLSESFQCPRCKQPASVFIKIE